MAFHLLKISITNDIVVSQFADWDTKHVYTLATQPLTVHIIGVIQLERNAHGEALIRKDMEDTMVIWCSPPYR